MSFVCPHCGLAQVETSANSRSATMALQIGSFAEGDHPRHTSAEIGVRVQAVRCASEDCLRATVSAEVGTATPIQGGYTLSFGSVFAAGLPYPGRVGKPFPVGVPSEFLEDYNEAWSIVDLSPKASATLARRCLQGMIRDFCEIRERTLYHEIEELEARLETDQLPKGVEPETIEAMRALKDVGNIGAHMTEEDGKIVGVDPDEAETLLGLIEMLFADWYVSRFKRQEKLAAIKAVADRKKPAPPNAS